MRSTFYGNKLLFLTKNPMKNIRKYILNDLFFFNNLLYMNKKICLKGYEKHIFVK